ncbi:MAG: hypothetical protein HQ519_10805 [Planctomycetes bacterium]|nr:hypothetical protein [Planctomycetota bacterium]
MLESLIPVLSIHQLRPRFQLDVALPPHEVIQRLSDLIQNPSSPCTGMVADLQGHIDLQIAKEERHTWSPSMSINVEAKDAGSYLRVLIGPNPGIWTAVAFSYLGLITGIMFLVILGSVQLFLNKDAWAFQIVAAFTVLLIGVWIASRVGSRLATPQIVQLRGLLDSVLKE